MYARLLLLTYFTCACSLELTLTTPPPATMPHHRLHRAHEGSHDPKQLPTSHNDGAISKADVVMAVTDKFGTIVDNFAERLAEDFDDVFKNYLIPPQTTPPPTPDPQSNILPLGHGPGAEHWQGLEPPPRKYSSP